MLLLYKYKFSILETYIYNKIQHYRIAKLKVSKQYIHTKSYFSFIFGRFLIFTSA